MICLWHFWDKQKITIIKKEKATQTYGTDSNVVVLFFFFVFSKTYAVHTHEVRWNANRLRLLVHSAPIEKRPHEN